MLRSFVQLSPRREPIILPKKLWPFIWYFVSQAKKQYVFMVCSFALGSAFLAATPFFTKLFIDTLSSEAPKAHIIEDVLWLGGIFILICGIVQSTLWRLNAYLMAHVNPHFLDVIRHQLALYMNNHSIAYFQNDFIGRLSSKVIETPRALQKLTSDVSSSFVYYVTKFIVATGFLASVGLGQLLIVLSLISVYIFLLYKHLPSLQVQAKVAAEETSKVRGQYVDILTNILTVKLFAQNQAENKHFANVLKQHTAVNHHKEKVFFWFYAKLDVLMKCMWTLPPAYALYCWYLGSASMGDIAMVFALALDLGFIMWSFSYRISEFFNNLGQIEEGMETITKTHHVVDAPNATELVIRDASISFSSLKFMYAGMKDTPIFNNFSLNVKAGERIGLVGGSGAGKSTLVSLLLRLYDVQGGAIQIGGVDISKVTQDSLRRHMAMVTQEPALFHRSVLENIRYGRPEASKEEVINAAKKAHAHSFIEELPEGYATLVGERGVKLSGGQRQRIALARVILADASILILDEATSALDSEVESAIQEEMEGLMYGKTVIAIAHRLSTIRQLDRLIVLDKGHVVEDGTHQSLLRKKGHYYNLWQRQSGGFIGDKIA